MNATKQRTPLSARLASTINEESTARAGRFDALVGKDAMADKLRRADAVMGNGTLPPLAAASTRKGKCKAPKRVRPHTARDSFNLPMEDAALLNATLERALGFGAWTTKSSVVRAGLHVLAALPDAELREALAKAHPLTPGRKPGAV